MEIVAAKTRVADSPYYGINPSGRVPYLLCDNGVGLEESALICSYLAGRHPARNRSRRRMADLWETEIGHPLMRGALNLVQITLACALGLEARNPEFRWRPGHPRLCDWFDRIAARPSFAATKPPSAPPSSAPPRNAAGA